MTSPRVAVIVIQRERFSLTELSLRSILAERETYPFDLIYVDGNSPLHIQQYLKAQAERHDFFTLIRRERYLRANESRNLALPLASSADYDYVLFVDNDVVVEQGWLAPLVECAEAEGAAIVAPLTLQGNPASPEIEIHVVSVKTKFHPRKGNKRWFQQKQLMYATKLREVAEPFARTQVESVEFHCMLARRSFLDEAVLDPIFDSLASHTDLCLQAEAKGETVFLEPRSRVAFMVPTLVPHFEPTDLPFYRFKWSEPSIRAIFKRFGKKWNIAADDPSFWSIWSWVIRNRQLPAKWATAEGSFSRQVLEAVKSRWCPGWLRDAAERLVLRFKFPATGLVSDVDLQMSVPRDLPFRPEPTVQGATQDSTEKQPLLV